MIKKLVVISALLLVLLTVIGTAPAGILAQSPQNSPITVTGSTAKMDFPLKLSFSANIKSSREITDVRLRYQVDQASFAEVTSEAYINFGPGANVNAAYDLDMRKIGGLPAGASLKYWWFITDAGRSNLETAPIVFEVTDNRYTWQNLTEGKIALYWYQGNQSFARTLMSTAQEALAKLASDTGAVPEKTINIYIYNGAQDLRGSMIYPSEWTGGVTFTQYYIIAIGISPSNLAWGQGAMTHELTHAVISQVVFNPYSDLPVWLSEGLAMYNEGSLGTQFTSPLRQAISNNSLISVRIISSPFSAYADKANLSYAESYTLVEYLISQYKQNKMQELLNTFKSGSTHDGAIQKVYGFDMDGLNQQWQTWVKIKYGK